MEQKPLYERLKDATKLRKLERIDDAISLLKELYVEMSRQGGHTHSYPKIIPYFQAAGRYREALEYVEMELTRLVREDVEITFSSKSAETQNAFFHLTMSNIYNKLALNAKREKLIHDELKFQHIADDEFEKYEINLKLGNIRNFEQEKTEILRIFGSDKSTWPKVILEKFNGTNKDSK